MVVAVLEQLLPLLVSKLEGTALAHGRFLHSMVAPLRYCSALTGFDRSSSLENSHRRAACATTNRQSGEASPHSRTDRTPATSRAEGSRRRRLTVPETPPHRTDP